MLKFLFFAILFVSHTSGLYSQIPATTRRLPPSLEREYKLHRGGRSRIIGFVDTLKAQSLIAQSIRDTSVEELDSISVRDTAIITTDSTVSTSEKDWLDSMLAELPEFRSTDAGIRFDYPPEILVETTRKVVPQDTTLSSRMDPVLKEDLPIYDAAPMPKPLRRLDLPNSWFELGIGSPQLPRIDFLSRVLNTPNALLELTGKFRNTAAETPAVKLSWQLEASGNVLFPTEDALTSGRTPQFDFDAVAGAKRRLVVSESDSPPHTISLTRLGGALTIGSPAQLKLNSNVVVSLFGDNVGSGINENQAAISVSLSKQPEDSHLRINLDARYQTAALMIGTLAPKNPGFIEARLSGENNSNEIFQWKAGLSYLSGSNQGGNRTLLSPIVLIRSRLSERFVLGATYEANNYLEGLTELTEQNPFYSPLITASSRSIDSLYRGDARRVVREQIHLNIFASYFISPRTEGHLDFRYITRLDEPIFRVHYDPSGHTIFDSPPENTKRIELEAGANLILFGKDQLSTSLIFRSATESESGDVLPFVPNAEIELSYQLTNLVEDLIPKFELRYFSVLDRSLFYINLETRYMLNPRFQLTLRAENIFGSPGDFWPGYEEYPRSIWLSGRYSF
ncbi:MAG: TonB-dependent receptor [Ignavibacteriota bacterium]